MRRRAHRRAHPRDAPVVDVDDDANISRVTVCRVARLQSMTFVAQRGAPPRVGADARGRRRATAPTRAASARASAACASSSAALMMVKKEYGGCALDYFVARRDAADDDARGAWDIAYDDDDIVHGGVVDASSSYTSTSTSTSSSVVLARAEAPLRFVHGTGVIPSGSMPFRDKVYDQKTRAVFEYTGGGDGAIVVRASRALPVIGEEANMGSCGGSEWNEDVAFIREFPKTLRGVCAVGAVDAPSTASVESFSAGTLALRDGDEGVSQDDIDAGGVSFAPQIDGLFTFHSCLAYGDVRARIEHHVTYDAHARELRTHGFTMCVERENACVNDFSHKPAASMPEDVLDDARAWVIEHERRVDFAPPSSHFDEPIRRSEFTTDVVYAFPHRAWARVSSTKRDADDSRAAVVCVEHGGVNTAGVRRIVTRRYYDIADDRGALLAVVVRHERKA